MKKNFLALLLCVVMLVSVALVAAGCDLVYPVVSRNIINTYIPDKNIRLILTWCAALLVILLI